MNPKAIHELALSTIIDGIKNVPKLTEIIGGKMNDADTKKSKSDRDKNKVAQATSIARASAGLIFTYPVLCSSSLSIKPCMMVAKALERKNVTMLQILLAANQRTNQNIMDYLKDFHTNLDFDKMSLTDFVDVISETSNFSDITGIPESIMEMMPIKEKNMALEDFRNNTNYFFKESVNENSIGRFKALNRDGYNIVIEAEYDTKTKKINGEDFNEKDQMDKNGLYDETKYRDKNDPKKIYDNMKDPNTTVYKYGQSDQIRYRDGADKINNITAPRIDSDRLISSEVKKANEIVPTLMLINTIDPTTGVNMQSVVGVKSRLIAVPSTEITNRILANYQDSNLLLKFIKLTTRETSFIKDFLFAIDKAKLDAINSSKKGSATSLLRALERRSENGKIRKLAKTEKQFAKAIATIVVSQEDVEELKKANSVDVETFRVIRPIMEALNLLYFVIVDESSETVKILIDGADDYEVYPYSALEKENKDDSYKKVINLMTKMSK